MGETKGPKKDARTEGPAGGTPPANDPNLIPLSRLPHSVRRLLQSTPPREWYRIKAVRAKYEETVELAHLIPVLDYLLDMAPARCIARMRQKAISPQGIDDAFRRVRDAINGLKDSCRHIADLARLEIRAWQQERAPAAPPAPPAPRGPEREAS